MQRASAISNESNLLLSTVDDTPHEEYGTVKKLSRSESTSRTRKMKRESTVSFRMRLRYYIPIIAWLPDYNLNTFLGDLTAALSMTSLLVPQSISYATSLSGLPPSSGLISAGVPAIMYSFLGTSRQLSVGPEAALSLIIGQMIQKTLLEESHAHGKLSAAETLKISLTVSSIITFQSGIITLALGLFRLGFIDAVLSRALLRGFISAIALVILVAQLPTMLGMNSLISPEGTIEKLLFVIENLESTHLTTTIISIVSLLILVSCKIFKVRLAKRKGLRFLSFVPEVLVVVMGATFMSWLLSFDKDGLAILGKIDVGAIRIKVPFLHGEHHKNYLRECLSTSFVISILGFLDSIVAGKDLAKTFDYAISPNRELVALGVANSVVSLVSGALPAYGSITRSRLSGATGARSQMSALLAGFLVLFTTFNLLPFLYYLPKSILSSIVCVVVFSILSETPHEVAFFWKMRSGVDLCLMAITFFLTLIVSVEIGLGVSFVLSVLLCIRQSASIRIKILGKVLGSTDLFEPLDDDDLDELVEIPGVLIVRIADVALTFANAGTLKDRLRRLERYGREKSHPSELPKRESASVIIFDLVEVETVDASAAQLLHEAVSSYYHNQVLVYFARAHVDVLNQFRRAGVTELVGEEHMVSSIQEGLDHLESTTRAFDEI